MFLKRRKRHNEPLELRFSVASPRQRAKASVAPAKLIRNLEDDFATPQQLLGEALFQMRGMNRVDLETPVSAITTVQRERARSAGCACWPQRAAADCERESEARVAADDTAYKRWRNAS
jgi:hypothetical protein